jgi:NAD+ kinase
MMATIGMIPHPSRDEAVTLATITATWLIGEGHEAPVICGDITEGAAISESLRQQAKDLDLAVSLGGDGTMLRAVDLVSPFGIPVLGVNVGHLGFLT